MAREAANGGKAGRITIALNRVARLVVALVLAAVAASSALAGDRGHLPATARSAQVTVVERDGFDWADAGIGALAALGGVFVVAGLAVARYGGRSPLAALTPTRSPALARAHRRGGTKRKRRLS